MTQLLRWTRRLLGTTAVLILMAWMWAWGAQWVLRWRAERLLADIRALEVGTASSDAVHRFRGRWKNTETGKCTQEDCFYLNILNAPLPSLASYDEEGHGLRSLIPRLVVDLGLRSSLVRGGFHAEQGIITMTYFGEGVEDPMALHGRSRDIFAGSREIVGYAPYGGRTLLPLPDHRRVIPTKLGLLAEFDPALDSTKKRALMDFRFSCITQFKACLREDQILPEAGKMLGEQAAAGAP